VKTLAENTGCKYALTDSETADQSWSHARLGSGPGVKVKGVWIGGGAHQHLFCGEPRKADSNYCPAHHKLCYRGPGKDARSLEEMMYAIDQSQYRGKPAYADHTDPMDVELARERPAANDNAKWRGEKGAA
jgi:hypothetical protein